MRIGSKSADIFVTMDNSEVLNMRKSLVLLMTGIMLTASAVMPVSAHGHHHYNQNYTQNYTQTETPSDYVCEVCPVEGCDETGYHTHNEATYCGHEHECGYCDGSCVKTKDAGVSRQCGNRRHHGR